MPVSTHSRPKAAAFWRCVPASRCRRFNTQPPEGGCHPPRVRHPKSAGFNTQPPEGGCTAFPKTAAANGCFNTQPPEGGGCCWHGFSFLSSGFNTQPPEGGCQTSEQLNRAVVVSTHSRLKAAADCAPLLPTTTAGFINTQPPEGGCRSCCGLGCIFVCFNTQPPEGGCMLWRSAPVSFSGFNTQPPEGGCPAIALSRSSISVFQHTAA